MNPGRKRRLAAAKGAVSQSKCSKNEENEGDPALSVQTPSPDCEVGSCPYGEEGINCDSPSSTRRTARSKACSQALCPASETESEKYITVSVCIYVEMCVVKHECLVWLLFRIVYISTVN